MIRLVGPLLAAAAMLCAGCAVTGVPVATPEPASPSTQTPTIRQTDNARQRLPFDTQFPDRWSSNNNGTPYEPCTAVSADTLRRFNLDPTTAKDAAVANHQTIRGCDWEFVDTRSDSLVQTVGNGPSLGEYRAKNESAFIFLPDTTVNGRRVLRFAIGESSECSAAVQSGTAQVITTVFVFENEPPRDQLCEIPVNFLRATIDKIPR